MNKITLALGILILAILAGCVAHEEKEAKHTSNINENDTFYCDTCQSNSSSITESNNRFALDLYKQYQDEKGNIFFSPYSISTALGMTLEGAEGGTATIMEKILHLPNDKEKRHVEIKSIAEQINAKNKPYELSTVNRLWVQEGFPTDPQFMHLIQDVYGGSLEYVNFIKEPSQAHKAINTWVAEQTNQKIRDLVPKYAITSDTRTILTNAIYFKGQWKVQFEKENTQKLPFHTPQRTKEVPTMISLGNTFFYAENEHAQVLELPYEGEELVMRIILPKGELHEVENEFTHETIVLWTEQLQKQRVEVYLPKFTFETKYMMKETLTNMGMGLAFSNDANFQGSENSEEVELKIGQVIHQAFIEVNEEGTEAAAATAVSLVVITSVSPPSPPPKIFRADHPFIFLIQQKDSGNILFMGRVNNPQA